MNKQRLLELAGIIVEEGSAEEKTAEPKQDSKKIDKAEYVLKKHSSILSEEDLWALKEYLKWLQKGTGRVRPVGGISPDTVEQRTIDTAKTIIKYLSKV